MKRIYSLLSVLFVFTACGPSVKVTDTWKSDDILEVKGERFLVMTRSDDMVSRQRLEDEMVAALLEGGLKAEACHKVYKDIKLNTKYTDEQIDEQVRRFKADGFEGIVLTVLKDVKTEIVTQETGSSYYPSYYGGFGPYYGRYHSPYGYGGVYSSSSARTYSSDTYKLETVVYDLLREQDKQLVAVVSIDIVDPKSASQIAEKYAKKVVIQFEE